MVQPAQLVRLIHAAPLRVVLVVTGGGASAIDRLFAVSGASRTMLEAIVPYSAAALDRFLGGSPEQYGSPATARAMAMTAFVRAREYAGDEDTALAGIACTASLASDRPKRGAHRAHLAVQTAAATVTESLEFRKGHRTRRGEEKLLGRWLLNLIAQTAGRTECLDLDLLPDERIETHHAAARPGWEKLIVGDVPAVRHGPEPPPPRRAVFPGAFNPRHTGHRRLAEVARQRLDVAVEYEISMANVDKPPLDYFEMEKRLGQFLTDETVWFTRAPLFQDKAEQFPGATFLVGADTMARIAHPRYYGGDSAGRDSAVEHFARQDCRFLVFGRLMDGSFRTLSDISLPPALRSLCDEIPANKFREDISSTTLRQQEPLPLA